MSNGRLSYVIWMRNASHENKAEIMHALLYGVSLNFAPMAPVVAAFMTSIPWLESWISPRA